MTSASVSDHNSLLCVVVPLLNESRYIGVALESLLSQDYPALEVAVYDAGSTDGTLDIARRYPVEVIVEPGLGQMAAINRGWRRTTAEFVTWMAGDDRYLPGALRRLAGELQARPEAAFVHADAELIDASGRVTGRLSPGNVTLRDLVFEFSLVAQTVLIRRAALERSGMMDENRRFAADHDLFLRLTQYFPGCHVAFTAAQYRVHAASEDATHYPEVAAATIDVVQRFFERPDLSPAQRALKRHGLAGAHLFAGSAWCLVGRRGPAWRLFWQAVRLEPASLVTRRGLGLLVRLASPVQLGPYRLRGLCRKIGSPKAARFTKTS